jgi:site-specific DNA-methyltransferase (adenine-specific)
MEFNKIYCGNTLDVLKTFPDESINCCVTSPPYWALRDYGTDGVIWDGDADCEHEWGTSIKQDKNWRGGTTNPEVSPKMATKGKTNFAEVPISYSNFCIHCGAWKGQLGLEPDFNLYIKHLCDIFDEVKRVLRKDGTCWVNLGDTYGGNNSRGSNGGRAGFGNEREGIFSRFESKNLCNIPSRFSIEMQNRGWILRNKIIWHKPNCMPSSVTDRFTVDFEEIFFFVKNKKYWFEQQFEPWQDNNPNDINRAINGHKKYNGKFKDEDKKGSFAFSESKVAGDPRKGRNKRTVWKIPTQPFPDAHFAVFPEKLVETPIKAGCPKDICTKCGKPREKIIETKNNERTKKIGTGQDTDEGTKGRAGKMEIISETYTKCDCNAPFVPGIVLDPFMGSGTVALKALKENRRFVGIEINPKYIDMANERIRPLLSQSKLEGF